MDVTSKTGLLASPTKTVHKLNKVPDLLLFTVLYKPVAKLKKYPMDTPLYRAGHYLK